MSKRRDAFEAVFEIFVQEGRELNIGDLRESYPAEAAALRRAYKGSLNKALQRMRRIYRNRWNEIYDTELGVVHEKVNIPEDLSPLDALRNASLEDDDE